MEKLSKRFKWAHIPSHSISSLCSCSFNNVIYFAMGFSLHLNSSFKISCHCKVELSAHLVDSIIHIENHSKNRKQKRNGIYTPSKCVSLRLGLWIVFHLKYDGVLCWMPSSNQESFTVMPSKNVILSFWWGCIVFGDKCHRISNKSEDSKH